MLSRLSSPITLSALALFPGVPRLQAQSEAVLRQHFEGKTVTMKLAMPGTEDGVDIYPTAETPLDFPRYADRLKDNGTAIRSGESVMITKIKVKSKLIEFQLGGGGYGTTGDETSSNVGVSSTPKTKREKNLEAELKRETDPNKQRDMREEIDKLRSDREREDARNRASVAEAQEQKKLNIRQRRLEGGSRFNIRYRDGVPASALTPESIKQALAEYVVVRRAAGRPNATPAGRWRNDATQVRAPPKGNADDGSGCAPGHATEDLPAHGRSAQGGDAGVLHFRGCHQRRIRRGRPDSLYGDVELSRPERAVRLLAFAASLRRASWNRRLIAIAAAAARARGRRN